MGMPRFAAAKWWCIGGTPAVRGGRARWRLAHSLQKTAGAGRDRLSTTPERRRIGREARDAPTSGWIDVVWRVKDDETADNVSMIAAGAAFFGPPRAPLFVSLESPPA
jgi:hypothetical protein